jgi:hypothetical protein
MLERSAFELDYQYNLTKPREYLTLRHAIEIEETTSVPNHLLPP